MYYIIRIVILVIAALCLFFYLKRKGKLQEKRSKIAVIISVIAFALICTIVSIPIEASFVRFNSAKASVAYSTLNSNGKTESIETDKTAFTVSHKGNNWSYHVITKYDDKYGFCNRHSQIVNSFDAIPVDDGNNRGIFYVSKLVNYDTNEKCYMIDYLDHNLMKYNAAGITIYDEQDLPIEKITFEDNSAVFAAIANGIDQKTIFKFNGKTYELN